MQVLISAGEASGDMHASAVIRAMSELEPGVRFSGIAGKCMRNAGCSTLIPINELNVMGFGDVITVLPRILRVENAILSWAKEVRPAAAVLVDFPGFHMRLGHKLRQLDIPVLQYIAPKLWSWGKWRVQKLEVEFFILIARRRLSACFLEADKESSSVIFQSWLVC